MDSATKGAATRAAPKSILQKRAGREGDMIPDAGCLGSGEVPAGSLEVIHVDVTGEGLAEALADAAVSWTFSFRRTGAVAFAGSAYEKLPVQNQHRRSAASVVLRTLLRASPDLRLQYLGYNRRRRSFVARPLAGRWMIEHAGGPPERIPKH